MKTVLSDFGMAIVYFVCGSAYLALLMWFLDEIVSKM